MRVIVVDDREEERYLAETLLKGSGYEVVTAVNGAEALEKLRAEDFDMIVSDVLMPVMDGFRLCQECREDEKLKDIPFVFYTATYKDERDEELASKVGADRYIIKPIEPQEFVKIIQGVFRDMEKGRIVSKKKAVLEEEEEVFKLYSERLIAKLERKMLDLEAEITERKQAEERIVHLNSVLRAIRKVNQLIVQERDRNRLLKVACKDLVEARGYYNAWIALLDQSGKLVTTAEAGLGNKFLPLQECWKAGEPPHCARVTLAKPGVSVIEDPPTTCGDCPLAVAYTGRWELTCRLESGGNIYGLLTVSVTPDYAADEEEQSLFCEVAGDIGFALHSMELERERKKFEHRLMERMKELTIIYETSRILEENDDINKALSEIVKRITPAYQFPELACARIIYDNKAFKTKNFKKTAWGQSAIIRIPDKKVGVVEVFYLEKTPFLIEEQEMIKEVASQVGNITGRKKAEEKLKDSEERYRGLFENSSEFLFTLDLEGNFTSVNKAAVELTGYTKSELLEMNFKDYTPTSDHRKLFRAFYDVSKTGKPLKDFLVKAIVKDKTEKYFETSLSLLKKGDEIIGFQGSSKDITERKRAVERWQQGLVGIIGAMATALEARDPYTAGHQRRVGALACAIAREMGLSEEEINGLRMTATIHDLGKIQVPAEILSKPGKLTDTEFDLIKAHPRVGYDILKGIEFPWPIAQIVLQHHERVDGSGYPQGLSGEDILLEARVLGVADVVEAMASHRPYRPALGLDNALEEIEKNKGKLYDSEVTDTCIRIFTEGRFTFES